MIRAHAEAERNTNSAADVKNKKMQTAADRNCLLQSAFCYGNEENGDAVPKLVSTLGYDNEERR